MKTKLVVPTDRVANKYTSNQLSYHKPDIIPATTHTIHLGL